MRQDSRMKRLAEFLRRPGMRPLLWFIIAFAAWWTWMGIVMAAVALLKNGVITAEMFPSIQAALTLIMLVGLTVFYLRFVGKSSWLEGVGAGLVVMAVTIALDGWFYLRMTADIGMEQLVGSAPTYLVIPVVTTLILGLLRKR